MKSKDSIESQKPGSEPEINLIFLFILKFLHTSELQFFLTLYSASPMSI